MSGRTITYAISDRIGIINSNIVSTLLMSLQMYTACTKLDFPTVFQSYQWSFTSKSFSVVSKNGRVSVAITTYLSVRLSVLS